MYVWLDIILYYVHVCLTSVHLVVFFIGATWNVCMKAAVRSNQRIKNLYIPEYHLPWMLCY